MKLLSKFSRVNWLKVSLILFVLVLSFITRWLLPVQPNPGLVFDEVYFVPQVESYAVERYYFDPHPPLGKIILYYGMMLFNPDAATKVDAEKLGNKVDGYVSPLNLDGIRFMPHLFGTILPVIVFLLAWEFVNWNRKKDESGTKVISLFGYLVPFVVGLMAVFENSYIVESRYALLSQIMLVFMFGAVWMAIKYFHSASIKWNWIYLILTSLLMGCALATKWFALSIVPVIVILIIAKEWKLRKFKVRKRIIAANIYMHLLVCFVLVLLIYVGVFAWHFAHIKHYASAADEVTETYLADLKENTDTTSLSRKILDWHRLSLKYQKYVPELDYTKSDEIGSHWLDWPIMARPISYFWTTSGNGNYGFVYLIGNPAVWSLGLMGVICLAAFAVAKLFGTGIKFGAEYWLLLLFYFANWVPFSQISRVMYLYHYMPALLISMLIFGVVLSDFVLPRIFELGIRSKAWVATAHLKSESNDYKFVKRIKDFKSKIYRKLQPALLGFVESWPILVFIGIILFIALIFLAYAPLSYIWPISKDYFQILELRREWNMKWPGN